jgi:hypothetical protein|tara:strand:- start:18363 stop:19430 length:1068 start_codon:yes stop_codon:yes gene_type:complete
VYSVAVIGDSPVAHIAALASKAAGFADTKQFASLRKTTTDENTLHCIPASVSRIINALSPLSIESIGLCPDREQVRLGRSAYLLSELPLGNFYLERYGAPLVNCTRKELLELLAQHEAFDVDPAKKSLQEIEDDYDLAILCDGLQADPPSDERNVGGYEIFNANVAEEHLLRNANVTWIGKGQVILQRSSKSHTHYTFITHNQLPFEEPHWHDSLAPAFANKSFKGTFNPLQHLVAERFQDGRRAYLGDACYATHPGFLESHNSGMEDAWVLSRMMENYEEDIGDGLREYERFRRPRAIRVAKAGNQRLNLLTQKSSNSRFWGYVGQALSTRFLPEIAMQKQDWFHQHNVIKGFR